LSVQDIEELPSEDTVGDRIFRSGPVGPQVQGQADVGDLHRLPPLHRDPFDRMLICQAIAGGMAILRAYSSRPSWLRPAASPRCFVALLDDRLR
jgi:hypothetical protein